LWTKVIPSTTTLKVQENQIIVGGKKKTQVIQEVYLLTPVIVLKSCNKVLAPSQSLVYKTFAFLITFQNDL
jgi:hypothetical protein